MFSMFILMDALLLSGLGWVFIPRPSNQQGVGGRTTRSYPTWPGCLWVTTTGSNDEGSMDTTIVAALLGVCTTPLTTTHEPLSIQHPHMFLRNSAEA